jgi:hypothetical protein
VTVSISKWREVFGGLIALLFCGLGAFYFYQTTTGANFWGSMAMGMAHLVIGTAFFGLLGKLQVEVGDGVDAPVEETNS